MTRRTGGGWKLRTAVIAGTCAIALAGVAGTAEASTVHSGGNASPQSSSSDLYGPGGATLGYFCTQFSLWHKGAAFFGVNNHGDNDGWGVTGVTDTTQGTRFEGVDEFQQIVAWYC